MRRTRDTSPSVHYLPYYRRLLLRSVLFWIAVRIPATAALRELEGPDAGLHPVVSVLIIGAVLAIGAVHSGIMREDVFRGNAGISLRDVAFVSALPAIILETTARVLL